ncbi:hypothetical protein L195_g061769, partial [Trifolium pratense]
MIVEFTLFSLLSGFQNVRYGGNYGEPCDVETQAGRHYYRSCVRLVAPEPRGISSTLTPGDPRLYTVVEDSRNGPANWETHLPEEGKRICSPFSKDGFAMYELAFK